MLSRFSHVQLFLTLLTVAHQAPLSMGFARQEYWSGLPCPPPRDLPEPGIKNVATSPGLQVGGFFTTSATWEAPFYLISCQNPTYDSFLKVSSNVESKIASMNSSYSVTLKIHWAILQLE